MVLKSKVRISSILFRFVVIMLTVAVAFLTIGLIIFMVAAIKIKNISSIARVLSCICLVLTMIQEIIGIIKIEHKINVEGERKQEEKIKRMESESNT